jgi:hypothetical protein
MEHRGHRAIKGRSPCALWTRGSFIRRRRLRQKKGGRITRFFPAGPDIFGPDHLSPRIYRLHPPEIHFRCDVETITYQLTPSDFLGWECPFARRPSHQVARILSSTAAGTYRRSSLSYCFERALRLARWLLGDLALRLGRHEHAYSPPHRERRQLSCVLTALRGQPFRICSDGGGI